MIAESVAFLVGEGKRVVYDAEHFFDGFADDPAYALRCLRAAAEAGAETVICCDTNGGTLPDADRRARWPTSWPRWLRAARGSGIHCHDDAGCGVANSLAAVRPGRHPRPGDDERLRRALRQRQPGHDHPQPPAQARLRVPDRRAARLADRRPRTSSTSCSTSPPTPTSPTSGATPSPTRAACTSPASTPIRRPSSTSIPTVVGNHRELLISELSGKGTVQARARDAGIALDDAGAARVVERVKELEHRGYHYEAADGSFELLLRKETGRVRAAVPLESWRAIVEKRADGRVETEATIKIWVDGERYVRTAEGNGPVNALDRALRDALVEIHPHLRDIDLVNFKVRILDETKGTGAVTRVLLDASDGEQVWGSIGVSENVIEASWEALVDSLEYGMQAGRRPAATTAAAGRPAREPARGGGDPARLAGARRAPRRSACSTCCAPGGCRWARCWREFERAFAARVGAAHASAVSSGTAGLHLALRAVGVERRRRGRHHARSRSWPAPTSPSTSAPGPVFADIDPVTLNLDPRGRGRRGDRAHGGAAAGAHLRLSGRHPGVRAARAADRRGRLRGARRRARRRRAGGRTGPSGRVRLLRQQAADHRRGRDGHHRRSADQGADRLRAQPGPRARTWTGSTTTGSGFNYRLSDIACALGLAQLERLDEMLAGAGAGGRRSTARRWPGSRGSSCPARTPAATGAAGSCSSSSCRAGSTATRSSARSASAGVPSKPYFPAVHLMSFYRERFGHREGEFPVCEDVAARSIALPFFPEMTEGQVERVAADARAACSGATAIHARHVPLRRAPARRLPRPERLAALRLAPGSLRRRAVARPRGDARRPGDHLRRPSATSCTGRSTRSQASCATARSRSPRATRTSTWRSSAG